MITIIKPKYYHYCLCSIFKNALNALNKGDINYEKRNTSRISESCIYGYS